MIRWLAALFTGPEKPSKEPAALGAVSFSRRPSDAVWKFLMNDKTTDALEDMVEHEVVERGRRAFAIILEIISRSESGSGPDWKDITMALADIIAAATTAVNENTATFVAAVQAAATSDTSGLQAQIKALQDQITVLQGELDAATTATTALTAAVDAQHTAAAGAGTPPPPPPPPALAFSPATLPSGTTGQPYSATIPAATGGIDPIAYSAADTGASGLTVDKDGTVTGASPVAGTYEIAVIATDATGATAGANMTVTIA